MIFHQSNYGTFGTAFITDLDGFVGTSGEDVMALRWPYDLTREEADHIAADNHAALQEADAAIADWRTRLSEDATR